METTNKTTKASIYQSSTDTRINTGSWSNHIPLRSPPNSAATSASVAMTQRRRIVIRHQAFKCRQTVRIILTTTCTEEWGNHRISASTKKMSKPYKSSLKTLSEELTRFKGSIHRVMLRNKIPSNIRRTIKTLALLRWLGRKWRQHSKKYQAQLICHLTNHDTWVATVKRTTLLLQSSKNSKAQLLMSRTQSKS